MEGAKNKTKQPAFKRKIRKKPGNKIAGEYFQFHNQERVESLENCYFKNGYSNWML